MTSDEIYKARNETAQLFVMCASFLSGLMILATFFQGCDKTLTQRNEAARFIEQGYAKQTNADGSYKWEKSDI